MNLPCFWQSIPNPAPSSWSRPKEMHSSLLTLPHSFALPRQKCLELFNQALLINLVFTLNPFLFVCITCFSPCRLFTLAFPCHHEAELTFPSRIPAGAPHFPLTFAWTDALHPQGLCLLSPAMAPLLQLLEGGLEKLWFNFFNEA